MSRDGIARWKQPIVAAAGLDAFESMVQEVLEMSNEAAPDGMTPQNASAHPLPSPIQKEAGMVVRDVGASSEAVVGKERTVQPAEGLPVPRWLFRLIGHVMAAVFGLGLGYLVLHWLRPETFAWPW